MYGLIKFPIGIFNFTVVVTLWAVALGGTTFPAWGWLVPSDFGDDHPIDGWWKVGWIAANFVVGVAALIATPHVVRGLAAMDRGLINGLLSGSPTAELRQRVEKLTVSRDASVDVADTERRRIERDLHDGVQAQLVTLAMDLGMARQKLQDGDDADPAVLALVERAHDDSKRAVSDLRNLVRGIHPAVLTDRGLDAAVSALAARSPIPVEVNISLPSRPPATVESAAYFVIAEALTNAAKHSGASMVRVDGRVVDGRDADRGPRRRHRRCRCRARRRSRGSGVAPRCHRGPPARRQPDRRPDHGARRTAARRAGTLWPPPAAPAP